MKNIDKIAREKERDVLFVSFEPEGSDRANLFPAPHHSYPEWREDSNLSALCVWLTSAGIEHYPVGHIASENGWVAYGGNLYVDVPYDQHDPAFSLVRNHLENPDGSPRNPLVKLWVVTLEQALENKHHDEPGFWERWAETF